MNILIVGGFDQSLVRFRGELIRSWIQSGHDVYACAPNISASIGQQISALGASPISVSMERTGKSVVRDMSYLVQLTRVMRRIKPSRTLLYTMKPVIYGSIASRLAGTSGVFSMITGLGYSLSSHDRRRRWLRAIVRILLRIALSNNDAVIFQNPDDRDEFEELGILSRGRAAHVVNGSGVDCSHFSVAPLPDAPAVLLIARLLKEKGIREYVDAARRVRAIKPGVPFLLAGWLDENPDSISQSELEQWMDEGVIDYRGEQEDVRDVISKCSIYVLPSYREGTPRTVLEAMSMGRAIVTTDVPGCRETVEHGVNGLLVPARDAKSLADAILEILESPALISAMGSKSRGIAEAKYDVHIVNQSVNRIVGL